MLETILNWDYALFSWINQGLSNPFFDIVLVWTRNSIFWIPLYLSIISFFIINLGRKGYWIVLFCLLTVFTSDTISSGLIKKTVKRDRPCRSEFVENVNIRVRCGRAYSFTSSHATNHFAIAAFLVFSLGMFFKWIKPVLFAWAGIIGFAQIYVGVHFPFDVLVGSFNGLIIGWFWSKVFKKYYFYTIETRFS
jgi:membrane-associated phospholipid phosphatase